MKKDLVFNIGDFCILKYRSPTYRGCVKGYHHNGLFVITSLLKENRFGFVYSVMPIEYYDFKDLYTKEELFTHTYYVRDIDIIKVYCYQSSLGI